MDPSGLWAPPRPPGTCAAPPPRIESSRPMMTSRPREKGRRSSKGHCSAGGRWPGLFHPVETDDHLARIPLTYAHEERARDPLQFRRRRLEFRLRAEVDE